MPSAAAAQEAVFLIRHAERADGDDPPITEAGRDRARTWAMMLAGSGIAKIFTSEALRTRQTGEIISEALGVEAEALPASDTQALLDVLEWDHERDRVLVVGHTETIPGIVTGLGGSDLIEMSKDDYGRFFIVFPGAGHPVILDMTMQ